MWNTDYLEKKKKPDVFLPGENYGVSHGVFVRKDAGKWRAIKWYNQKGYSLKGSMKALSLQKTLWSFTFNKDKRPKGLQICGSFTRILSIYFRMLE